ncbi:L,D-transpeptidase family protein [Parvibaculum sp.]|uniref:L,D-transpeptidase family protein n=1 Tax=Parvibaculum sp. TaxID=2024848 RepID=UPI002C799453|nr:L,D-transpeptidase family protein [Parvibaculum sp.]HUD51369.1 L,D-transpeptidase family protein [Parvibaculum sp.]
MKRSLRHLFCGAGILAAAMLSLAQPGAADDLIGFTTIYETRDEDTLPDIARRFDLGYVEVRTANPDIDPWLPGAGKWLTLPTQHIIPRAVRRGIVINLPELRLYYFAANGQVMSFPLGIGGEGKETPVGTTKVRAKRIHPTWVPTASEHAETPNLPQSVGPGPDNPMGELALYLAWPGYAIHGTNKPYSIGRRDSHGCIRLYPQDIDALFSVVTVGTPVTVVNEPIKAGWSNGELYVEVHPYETDADTIETVGKARTEAAIDVDDMITSTAGAEVERVDWNAVERAMHQRTGIPVRVTLPVESPSP